MPWDKTQKLDSKQYKCGWCSNQVGSADGYYMEGSIAHIYICPHCELPSFFIRDGIQYPGVIPGNDIANLPDDINSLFLEARKSASVKSCTASVLACRKLLMNIAVSKGAQEGKKFIEYVQYLSDQHYVPPNGKGWVDHIRKKGNEATHEIALMSKEDAEELILFIEMLLKFIYEFPSKIIATP
jgi:hypothetical protein